MALTKIKLNTMVTGTLTDANIPDDITIDATTLSTNFTVTANNSTDETVYPIFVDGATGTQGAETDTGLTYNPSSGLLTATGFSGNITGNVTGNTSGTAATVTGAAQSAITSVGTLTGLTVQGSNYTTLSIQSGTTSHGAILNLGSSDDIDYGSITQFASGAGEGGRMRFKAGTTEVLNLYSNGNATFAGDIGVGGNTLNSWNSLHSAIQLGYGAVAVRQNNNTTYLTNNIYYEDSGSANPTYMHENEASALMCSDGNMLFFNAPSGTGTATLTERLRVDTEGNVGIGSGSNTNSHIVRGFSANKGLVIETQQPAIQLVDSDNNSRYFTIAYEQGAKTAYIHNQSNGPIRFDTNGVERFNIEGGGKLQSTSGIYFTGTGLDGTNTGIASSGDGGDLRVYISGNQNYTFSGHTLKIDSQGNGTPAQLTCTNSGSSGWTGAAVNLIYTGTSGNRGQGVYMQSEASDTEWYAGTIYSSSNDRYSICYEGTASFTEATAASAHEVLYVAQNGAAYNDQNTWGSTSDKRIKHDIKDANSQWDDIKALKIKNYKHTKHGDNAKSLIGVIAQDLESSGMNGLVDDQVVTKSDIDMYKDINEGDKIKTVKYSVLYMKAIKALQEAMERIEALENA